MAILNLDPNLVLAIAGILVVLGLALAFFGRGILKKIIATIGMILGGVIGYLGGSVISGGSGYLAIGLALVGAFIGLILFWKLVKIGFALALGILAAALVFLSFGPPASPTGAGDSRVIAAIVAFLIVFGISYYFIEELIGIITAIIGGILVGVGAYLFLGPDTVGGIRTWIAAAAVGGVIFFAGAAFQTMQVRRKKRSVAAIAAPTVYAPPPPPPQ